MSWIAAVIGRLMLAALFLLSGISKLADPGQAAGILQSAHLPANLAMPTGIFEVVAGVMLAVGLMTRLVSLALFVFVGLTIFFVHNQFGDPLQLTMALKNLAIMGGLLMTFAYGQMRGSYDFMRERRRTQDAEIRLAHAEGKAEGATAVPHTVVTAPPATVVTARPATVVADAPRTVIADTPRTVVTDVDGDGVSEVRER
ncbi:MAG: DoxX family protein [Croceibacterium sp.]